MGKKTRKKRQSNNKSTQQHPKKEEDNNDTNTNSSVLLQRIRHSDPRTRHAALAAVANTLLDTSRTTAPKTPNTLLQAIRERVLDADLDVSQVAAGCLANYVTIVASLEAPPPVNTASTTAGWTLVLVGRLKQCYEQLLAQNSTQEDDNSKSKKKKAPPTSVAKLQKQWLALAVQCLRTLCLLTETNPEAVGRLTSGMDATPRRDFHQTLLEWMQQCLWFYGSSESEQSFHGFYNQILTLAARTLHSAWDDNADLLLPWREECGDAFQRGVELLETIMKQPQNIPVVAQLHCTGAFLTARPFVDSQQAIACTQQTVLPKLTLQVGSFSWTTAEALLGAYQDASTEWRKEQADDALEKEIIRKVEERKEPSRDIAKRQKAQKEAKKKSEDEKMQDDTAAVPEIKEVNEDAMDDAEEQHKQQVETQQALEQARDAWNQFLLPLHLSLELLANLTSAIIEEEEDQEMVMDEDWGAEQEAQWMQEQQQMQQNGNKQSAEEEVLQKLLLDSPLPQQLKQLSLQVYQIPSNLVFPEQSRCDLEDLQSKTMACLGNCWENISQWPAQAVSWSELQQAAVTATGLGKEGLVSAMVIALRTYPTVRKEWQPDHVSFWLNELGNTSNNDTVRRDICTMLGILCSQEPHPAEVNQKICAALLAASEAATNSVVVPCEILNVLMDMYGNDEDEACCHTSVFESLHVLSHFQRSIPTLKQKLKHQPTVDKVEVEQWKETLLNGSRFVQYKKGQL